MLRTLTKCGIASTGEFSGSIPLWMRRMLSLMTFLKIKERGWLLVSGKPLFLRFEIDVCHFSLRRRKYRHRTFWARSPWNDRIGEHCRSSIPVSQHWRRLYSSFTSCKVLFYREWWSGARRIDPPTTHTWTVDSYTEDNGSRPTRENGKYNG